MDQESATWPELGPMGVEADEDDPTAAEFSRSVPKGKRRSVKVDAELDMNDENGDVRCAHQYVCFLFFKFYFFDPDFFL